MSLLISPYESLLSHSRFLLSLRSKENVYSSLILFRLSSSDDTKAYNEAIDSNERDAYSQIYIMESACPHLGADMSHADIEECESSVVAVCPWHRYDFDLSTGKSDTGLKACTFKVQVRRDEEDGVMKVYMVELPEGGTDWRVVELRPVSEEFADPPPPPPVQSESHQSAPTPQEREMDPVVPLEDPPTTLMEWAVLILNTPHPTLKVERTKQAVHLFRTGKLKSIGHKSPKAPKPPQYPARDETYTRNIVDPTKVKNRKGRAAMLHALANIEQWAIDLAWDIMARFGPKHPNLPPAFFADFTKMALDESKHFTLLSSRLSAISPHTPYGSLPLHTNLWSSALSTSESLLGRLAIIHLVHEARGLDINPATIQKFQKAGDVDTVDVMKIVHADEVTHVTAGHRWFVWGCETGIDGAERRIDPVERFREEVKNGWVGEIKGPFNVEDREKAGLTPAFYVDLKGEMAPGEMSKSERGVGKWGETQAAEKNENGMTAEVDEIRKLTDGVSVLRVEYET
ncbi:DUF455-domain-containing protein [Coprinopsis marcescibilis]|uniref:DUF455-domain-containing protein n=1 Tax=Coprinopsis marcescibilis TaxID=230819 RepID=A0A5C3KJ07_COPMA|nr:DUF455-domain-containing protein [Coprinopsis marcescibilis]